MFVSNCIPNWIKNISIELIKLKKNKEDNWKEDNI